MPANWLQRLNSFAKVLNRRITQYDMCISLIRIYFCGITKTSCEVTKSIAWLTSDSVADISLQYSDSIVLAAGSQRGFL